ncbi:MAG: TolC family protein [Isosphaeraceae bacterium]
MHVDRWFRSLFRQTGLTLLVVWFLPAARGEDLQEAWRLALACNQELRSSRQSAEASGFDLAAARAERMPKVQSLTGETYLFQPLSLTGFSSGGSGTGTGSGSSRGQGVSQSDFTFSVVAATLPIYSGGRVRHTIEANHAQVNAARADACRTTLDVKIDVARSYVGVLRAGHALALARSNVQSLSAHARDVGNLVEQGRAIRNDLLAAQVALANARQREILSRNQLAIAWATYNRYLNRPLEMTVPLRDLSVPVPARDPADLAAEAIRAEAKPLDEQEVSGLIDRALHVRPELISLTEQVRAFDAKAAAELAAFKPQASLVVANIYQNARFLPSTTQENGAAGVLLNWTLFDGGRARRKSLAQERRGMSAVSQRADLAAAIALQVRSAWLNTQETRLRIPVTRAAIVQGNENLRVARNRYLQQRGTNTEVLDAENLRIQAYDNFYNATYDAVLADFELHRAIGDL